MSKQRGDVEAARHLRRDQQQGRGRLEGRRHRGAAAQEGRGRDVREFAEALDREAPEERHQ